MIDQAIRTGLLDSIRKNDKELPIMNRHDDSETQRLATELKA